MDRNVFRYSLAITLVLCTEQGSGYSSGLGELFIGLGTPPLHGRLITM